ncbi:MAG: putative porin [Selenomonas sp.]|uniref:S-layer homology domain-containing protein n=1 Tax=Selenomonas sp. TaxID=2053611 RepID=UPI0025F78BDD|nr:putative porin [Selenomonas sp.]MCR5439063.1 putative porin [Selenomonas sp.]
MKCKSIGVLVMALTVFFTNSVLAAGNPFADVPADHWAYEAVNNLVADGVLTGYEDMTFKGQKEITRQEMAMMVARAMVAENNVEVSSRDKQAIVQLAVEFSDELNSLGLRVNRLEQQADLITWQGKVEYTYKQARGDLLVGRDSSNAMLLRLEPAASLSANWQVRARLEAASELSRDETGTVNLKRLYAQGDYASWQMKLGKLPLYTNEEGLLWDGQYSGGQASFGGGWKRQQGAVLTLLGGRLSPQELPSSLGLVSDEAADLFGVNLDGTKKKGTAGVGAYRLKSDSWNKAYFAGENTATIWSLHGAYRFTDRLCLSGAYGENTKANSQDTAWQTELVYGRYQPEAQGSWQLYSAYRQLGEAVAAAGTGDALHYGQKGWEVGAKYAPWKNVGLILKYGDGEEIDSHQGVKQYFARVECFF